MCHSYAHASMAQWNVCKQMLLAHILTDCALYVSRRYHLERSGSQARYCLGRATNGQLSSGSWVSRELHAFMSFIGLLVREWWKGVDC